MERSDRLQMGRALENLGFRPAPHSIDCCDGYVDSETEHDGIYFNISKTNDMIQLLVVGPMARRPVDYANMIGRGYRVQASGFLSVAATAPADARRAIIERGFISILLDVEISILG